VKKSTSGLGLQTSGSGTLEFFLKPGARCLKPKGIFTSSVSHGPPTPAYTPAYLRYALGLLCLVYAVNYLDRQILAILLQSIKQELRLSDAQLGLLSGTAFGLFYATLGVPIARLADRSSRRGVMVVCLALWSLMTALCGTASSFALLLAYRIGVGVGEAGGSPPAHSMISDYFPPERRATALGVFALGVPLGHLIGNAAGGWLDEVVGWRLALVAAGAPGLALALLVALTLREPARGYSEGLAHEAAAAPTTGEVLSFLWRSRSFRNLAFGAALNGFYAYSIMMWTPAFLMRSHGMGAAETGAWLAAILGIGGAAGNYFGGVLGDRWARSDPRSRLWLPGILVAAGFPFAFVAVTASDRATALLGLAPAMLLGSASTAPQFAAAQFLATPAMRATAAAVYLFAVNIVGLGLGPLAIGWLSDALAPRYGDASLARALLVASAALVWSGFHFFRAGRTFEADLEHARRTATR